ncbi:hypothetical protein Tco_1391989 [Tanacetum coccineum]
MLGSSSFSKQNSQVNKIASSSEICSGPRTPIINEKSRVQLLLICIYAYLTKRNAKTSRFEADFKQYHSEVTNKLDAFLKAIQYQMTMSTPKWIRSTNVFFKSVNAIQTCFKSATCDKKDQLQINTLRVNESETPTLKEPEKTLEDEFVDLHLNLPVLELLAHVLMYDALLDKYIISLELAKNGSEYIQSVAPERMKDPVLLHST